MPVASSAERGNRAAGFLPSIYDADEAIASPRQDMIRGPKPADSEHHGQRCNAQPASTYRCTGDSSPAARPCPAFPDNQPAATPFADINMETSSNKKGSQGKRSEESKIATDSNRGTNERNEEVVWLTPYFADDDAKSDEIDVTEEFLQSLECLSTELLLLRDHGDLVHLTTDALDGAAKLRRFIKCYSCPDGFIHLKEACAEVSPGVSSSECFSQLRSAGILSNGLADWNHVIGAPLDSAYMDNCYRIMRNQRGGLVLRIQPFVYYEALEWLKSILETIEKLECKNRSSTSTRNLAKGEKK